MQSAGRALGVARVRIRSSHPATHVATRFAAGCWITRMRLPGPSIGRRVTRHVRRSHRYPSRQQIGILDLARLRQ